MKNNEPNTVLGVIKAIWHPYKPYFYPQQKSSVLWLLEFWFASVVVCVCLLDILDVLSIYRSATGNKITGLFFAPLLAMVVALFFIRILSFKIPPTAISLSRDKRTKTPLLNACR